MRDPSSGQYYYSNKVTGESTWTAPADYVPADGAPRPSQKGDGLNDALKQSLDRYRAFVQGKIFMTANKIFARKQLTSQARYVYIFSQLSISALIVSCAVAFVM